MSPCSYQNMSLLILNALVLLFGAVLAGKQSCTLEYQPITPPYCSSAVALHKLYTLPFSFIALNVSFIKINKYLVSQNIINKNDKKNRFSQGQQHLFKMILSLPVLPYLLLPWVRCYSQQDTWGQDKIYWLPFWSALVLSTFIQSL